MLIEIINKILFVFFFMSILTMFRHLYYFIQAIVTSTDEQPNKYRLSPKSLLILGISIAYLITSIFTGIRI